jgi:hypothetical protein
MPTRPDEETPSHAQKRLQSFLDCVARLLAKRWLREQRQQEPPEIDDPDGSDEAQ